MECPNSFVIGESGRGNALPHNLITRYVTVSRHPYQAHLRFYCGKAKVLRIDKFCSALMKNYERLKSAALLMEDEALLDLLLSKVNSKEFNICSMALSSLAGQLAISIAAIESFLVIKKLSSWPYFGSIA